MDIASLDTRVTCDRGAWLFLHHPKTGQPILDEATGEPVAILLLGKDSETFRKVALAQETARIEKSRRSNGHYRPSAEEINEEVMEVFVACTKDWKHVRFGSPEPLPCTPENVRRVYGVPAVREQVDAFITTRTNFLGN